MLPRPLRIGQKDAFFPWAYPERLRHRGHGLAMYGYIEKGKLILLFENIGSLLFENIGMLSPG